MTLDGGLVVELTIAHQQVQQVQLSSSRVVDACRALVGLPVEQALRAVPRLFSVCAQAQSVAAREACEAALGVSPHAGRRAERGLAVASEAIDNHALQLALTWPPLFDAAPEVPRLKVLRAATERLREVDLRQASQAAGAVEAALRELLGPPLPARADGLQAWARPSEGLAQRLVAGLLSEHLEGLGHGPVPLLPELEAAWFDQQLKADARFEWHPTWQGAAAETGALARHQHHSLVAELLGLHGHGLLTRLIARLVDLEAQARALKGHVQNLRPAPGAEPLLQGSGQGVAVVDTSRGRLAHAMTVEQGRVVGWRVVAPTEWNFHPQGALAAGLLGLRARGVQRMASLLINSLDPCVGFELRLRGQADA